MAQKQVTAHGKKGKTHKAKAHKKPSHKVEIHKIDNGFKVLSHYEPDMDDANPGMSMGYQEPDEHAFSGPQAGQQAIDHTMGAMGMTPPAGEPDGDEKPAPEEAA